MATIAEQVCAQLDSRLNAAEAAIAADNGASTVLAAVLAEFRRKFAKTRPAVEGDPGSGQREAVIELEQAADSTKWAALADTGASEQTKLAVVSAHELDLLVQGNRRPSRSRACRTGSARWIERNDNGWAGAQCGDRGCREQTGEGAMAGGGYGNADGSPSNNGPGLW